jgi:hypothetical protein
LVLEAHDRLLRHSATAKQYCPSSSAVARHFDYLSKPFEPADFYAAIDRWGTGSLKPLKQTDQPGSPNRMAARPTIKTDS